MFSLRVVVAFLLSQLLLVFIVAGKSLRQDQNPLPSRDARPNSLGEYHHRSPHRHKIQGHSLLLGEHPADESPRRLSRDQYNSLTDLEKKWYISKPEFWYHGYEIRLHYNVSEDIADEAISLKIYDGIDCSRGSNEIVDGDNDYLFPSIEENSIETFIEAENKPTPGSTGLRHITVQLRVDTDRIRFTPLYLDYGRFSQVSFCVKLGAFHEEAGWAAPIEVNWVETPVLLMMDSVSFTLNGPSQFDSAYSVYETRSVDVELCDSDSNIIGTSEEMAAEGQLVRVCVNEGEQTLTEGGTLLYVEEFSYSRSQLTQQVIKPRTGGESAPASAPIQCDEGGSGARVCYFETYLGPEFFSSTGIIDGYGTAFLQFGAINNSTQGARGENTIENAEFDRSGNVRIVPVPFGLKMVALPPENRSSASNMPRSTKFALVVVGALAKFLLCFSLW